jgi:predicted ATPase
MAYIKEVLVERLAGREASTHLEFNADVNVLFGANGSGKTSLLRLLHSAMLGKAKELRRIAFGAAIVDIREAVIMTPSMERPYFGNLIRATLKELSNVGQMVLISGAKDGPEMDVTAKKVWYNASPSLGEQVTELRHTYLPISRLYVNEDKRFARLRRDPNLGAILSETELDRLFTEMVNLLWLRYTRNTSLEIQDAQSKGLSNILQDFLASDDEAQTPFEADVPSAYRRLQTFLERQPRPWRPVISEEQFEQRIKHDPRMQRVLRDIEAVEIEVDNLNRPRKEFDSVLRDMISSEKRVQLGDRDIHAFSQSGEIQLEDLSSGERQLLRICIDVLMADGQPVLIDEPELSMHIDWQRKLIPALRALAPKSQLIIATHSPEIMASLKNSQIFEL